MLLGGRKMEVLIVPFPDAENRAASSITPHVHRGCCLEGDDGETGSRLVVAQQELAAVRSVPAQTRPIWSRLFELALSPFTS